MLSARNLFIVVWLAVQVLLPARVLFFARQDTRGHFSWNMYSQRYSCSANWVLTMPDGRVATIDGDEHLNRGSRLGLVYYRDILPGFHRYLCDYYRTQNLLGAIHGSVECSWNLGDPVQIVDTTVDVCTATNYGVLPR